MAAPVGVERADQGRPLLRRTWPFVCAGLAVLLLVLAVRDLSLGTPLSEPLGVLILGIALMVEVPLSVRIRSGARFENGILVERGEAAA